MPHTGQGRGCLSAGAQVTRLLKIKVIPDSKKDEVIQGKAFLVKVRAPAEKGLANKSVVELLSRYFSSRVRIVSGGRSRNKTVEIT